MSRPPRLGALLVAIALAAIAVPVADGGGRAGRGAARRTPVQAAVQAPAATKHASGAPCNVGIPIIGGAVSTITNAACGIGSHGRARCRLDRQRRRQLDPRRASRAG